MISAPTGMSVGLPTTLACDTAPPPLVGGGIASPVQSPLQQPVAGAGALGAPVVPAAASLGAATLGAPVGAGPVVAPFAPAAGPLAPMAAPLGLPGAAPAPIVTGGALAAPAPAVAAPPAGTAPAAQRLTTVAPGGQQGDADLVEATLGVLRQSPPGAQLVDRMLAVGAKVNVVSDAEFKAMGHGDAHAFFDPKIDTIFLRRSDLADQKNIRFAAVALAHEGTHLLDDVGQVSTPFINQAAQQIHAAGGPTSPRGSAVQAQSMFELTMIKEARAFVFAGQIAKDLGVKTPATDPTSVAAAGNNDQATYDRVWQALLATSYNPERRTAASRNF